MNKKNIMIGMTCGFLIIAGIIYCISTSGCSPKASISSSLSEEEQISGAPEGQSNAVPTLGELDAVISDSPEQPGEAAEIYVHICGAVVNPGVYQTKAGSRVCDLIELSGGLDKAAAGDYINQAEQVSDGQRIYIPTLEEVESLTASQYMEGDLNSVKDAGEDSGLININTASAEEFMSLPGIGQAKADSIIGYRTTNGNFKTIEELMNITGIKEGVFNRISSYITVE